MALFGKKKQEDDGSEEEDAKAFTPQPEKAKPWLDQAKHIADTGNFTYALACYVSAVKQAVALTAGAAVVAGAVVVASAGRITTSLNGHVKPALMCARTGTCWRRSTSTVWLS